MKIFGRKLLDYNTPIEVDFDELVFQKDGKETVVSLRSFPVEGDIGVRSNSGAISVHPRAANYIFVRPSRD